MKWLIVLLFSAPLLLTGCEAERKHKPDPLEIEVRSLPVAYVGTPFSVSVSASGGSEAGYHWTVINGALPPGMTLVSRTPAATITGAALFPGVHDFTLQVTDSDYASVQADFSIMVQTTIPLTISTTTLKDGLEGTAYSEQIDTAGGTREGYIWVVNNGVLPAGLTLAPGMPSATIQGVPTAAGSFTFTISVMDSLGNSSFRQFNLKIVPALVIATTALPGGTFGQPYLQNVAATGGSGQGYVWTVVQGALPPGLALGGGTPNATLQGVAMQTGVFGFRLQVTDSSGLQAEAPFACTVTYAPLVITTSGLSVATVGVLYSRTVAAAGGSGAGYQWVVTAGALAPGLTLASGTPAATIQGVATQDGQFDFTLRVTDSAGQSTTHFFPHAVVTPPLQILTTTLAPCLLDVPYSQSIQAGGAVGVPAWALHAGTLPAGLQLYPSSPDLLLAGIPTQSGNYVFQIRVQDASGASFIKPYNVSVVPSARAVTNSPLLPAGMELREYSLPVRVSGGSLPYREVSVVAGVLPPGLTLYSTQHGTSWSAGHLRGVPALVGAYQFTIRVTDNASVTADLSCTLVIQPATGPLVVATHTLGPWYPGERVDLELDAGGGSGGGYNWALAPGSALPPRLALAAGPWRIMGQPQIGGNYVLALEVTDSQNNVATRSFMVHVLPQTPWVCFGMPVRDEALFLASTDFQMPPASFDKIRNEISYTLQSLPAHYRIEVAVHGAQFGSAMFYSLRCFGAMTALNAASRAAAQQFLNIALVPVAGGFDALYPALNACRLAYSPTLKSCLIVSGAAPATGGGPAYLLAEVSVWWAGFNDCQATCVSIAPGTASPCYQQLALLLGGVFVAA